MCDQIRYIYKCRIYKGEFTVFILLEARRLIEARPHF